jgi:hypothetical protein
MVKIQTLQQHNGFVNLVLWLKLLVGTLVLPLVWLVSVLKVLLKTGITEKGLRMYVGLIFVMLSAAVMVCV